MISVFGLHMQHPRAKRSWVVPRRTGPIAREERNATANANVARPRRAEETKGASGSGSGSGSSKA